MALVKLICILCIIYLQLSCNKLSQWYSLLHAYYYDYPVFEFDDWIAIGSSGMLFSTKDPEKKWKVIGHLPVTGYIGVYDIAYSQDYWVAPINRASLLWENVKPLLVANDPKSPFYPANLSTDDIDLEREFRYRDASDVPRKISYGNGHWVQISVLGIIQIATDPKRDWKTVMNLNSNNSHSHSHSYWLREIAYGNGYWLAVGEWIGMNYRIRDRIIVMASDPSKNWKIVKLRTNENRHSRKNSALLNIVYGNGHWVAVGEDGLILVATDPTGIWKRVRSGTSASLRSVAYGNGHWVAVGDHTKWITFDGGAYTGKRKGVIVTAQNPNHSWEQVLTKTGMLCKDVKYGDGHWVVVGYDDDIRKDKSNYESDLYNFMTASDSSGPWDIPVYGIMTATDPKGPWDTPFLMIEDTKTVKTVVHNFQPFIAVEYRKK